MSIEIPSDLSNPIWRLQNLYLIKTKQATVSKLKLNKVQTILLDRIRGGVLSGGEVEDNVLKFRQGGVSTFYLLLHLDRAIFNPNITTGILADLKENLNYLFEIVRFAHESMPAEIRPRLGKDSSSELTFPANNSKIMVSLAIKSTTLHGLHVSEYAHMDQEDVERTIGACAPGAWVTTETTAKGRNFYWDKWLKLKEQGKPHIFLPWPLQEEYRIPQITEPDTMPPIVRTLTEISLAASILRDFGIEMQDAQFRYRREKRNQLETLFDQEMAEDEHSCFISTGGAFFDGKKIETLIREAKEAFIKDPPIEKTNEHEMWEARNSRHHYAAGADTSEGLASGDYSVLAILCVTCRRTAFRWRGRVGPDAFYRICNKWGSHYGHALLAPERNNHGHAVVMGLREIGYRNLYAQNQDTRLIGKPKRDLKYGWDTTHDSKVMMLDQLRTAIQGKFEDDEENFTPIFTVLDTEFLQETFNITEAEGKIEAVAGQHDDMVMAYAIAYQMYRRVESSLVGLSPKNIVLGTKLDSANY